MRGDVAVACPTPWAPGSGYAVAVTDRVPTGRLLSVAAENVAEVVAGRLTTAPAKTVLPAVADAETTNFTLLDATGMRREAVRAGHRTMKLTLPVWPPVPIDGGLEPPEPQPAARTPIRTTATWTWNSFMVIVSLFRAGTKNLLSTSPAASNSRPPPGLPSAALPLASLVTALR